MNKSININESNQKLQPATFNHNGQIKDIHISKLNKEFATTKEFFTDAYGATFFTNNHLARPCRKQKEKTEISTSLLTRQLEVCYNYSKKKTDAANPQKVLENFFQAISSKASNNEFYNDPLVKVIKKELPITETELGEQKKSALKHSLLLSQVSGYLKAWNKENSGVCFKLQLLLLNNLNIVLCSLSKNSDKQNKYNQKDVDAAVKKLILAGFLVDKNKSNNDKANSSNDKEEDK